MKSPEFGKSALIAALLVSAGLALSGPANAGKLYKWVDENGNVSYQDTPPPEGQKYEATQLSDKKLGRLKSEVADTKLADLVSEKPIVVYSVEDCDACDTVRAFLDKRRIPFQEKMIDNNDELKQELMKKAKKLQVPALTVGKDVVFGYRRSQIESVLTSAGYPINRPAADNNETAANDN